MFHFASMYEVTVGPMFRVASIIDVTVRPMSRFASIRHVPVRFHFMLLRPAASVGASVRFNSFCPG